MEWVKWILSPLINKLIFFCIVVLPVDAIITRIALLFVKSKPDLAGIMAVLVILCMVCINVVYWVSKFEPEAALNVVKVSIGDWWDERPRH